MSKIQVTSIINKACTILQIVEDIRQLHPELSSLALTNIKIIQVINSLEMHRKDADNRGVHSFTYDLTNDGITAVIEVYYHLSIAYVYDDIHYFYIIYFLSCGDLSLSPSFRCCSI